MMLGAIDFIKNYDGDKPLCIYLPLTYPHPPYAVEEPWYGITDRDAIPERTPAPEDWDAAKKPSILKGISETQNMRGWSEERWKELRGVYYGMCSRIDHQYGLLVDALKESGIYDDSAVFSFADHGDFTGDFGIVEKTQNTFEDCLTRVPFVIKPPKDVPVKARVSDAMVELIDFPATVEALTGITPNHTHFGKSLLPLVAGETDEHRDAVFCEGGRLKEEIHCSEINSNPNLNPEHEYYPRLAQQLLNGPQHTKATMCRTKDWKYTRRLYESDELYDLKNDPRETVNLIDDPNCAGILAELKERMLRFYHETSDVVPYDSDWR
jgi:arylsulfatase A-like enzyme